MKSAGLCSGVALLLWSTAFGAPSANELAAYKSAGAQLGALIDRAQQEGGIGQLKTPEVKRLVKIMSDEKRMLRAEEYPVSEMGALLETCDVANKASVSLMLFDLKAHLEPGVGPRQMQAATIELMNANILAFQDELGELQPFLVRCLAKEVSPMTQFVSALKPGELTDVRRQGLARARSALLQIYAGALQAASDSRYREDYRLAVLSAMAETSVHFASVIAPPVRKQLRDAARVAASKATGPIKVHLTGIASSLDNESCEALCKIQ